MTGFMTGFRRVEAFLSPGRTLGASIVRAVRTGLAMGLVSLSAVVLLLLLVPDAGLSAFPAGDAYPSAGSAVLLTPIIETLGLAVLYALVSGLTGSAVALPCLVIAAFAAWLHPHTGALMLIPASQFAVMAWQYALYHDELGLVGAFGGVTLAHATNNAVAVAAGALEQLLP